MGGANSCSVTSRAEALGQLENSERLFPGVAADYLAGRQNNNRIIENLPSSSYIPPPSYEESVNYKVDVISPPPKIFLQDNVTKKIVAIYDSNTGEVQRATRPIVPTVKNLPTAIISTPLEREIIKQAPKVTVAAIRNDIQTALPGHCNSNMLWDPTNKTCVERTLLNEIRLRQKKTPPSIKSPSRPTKQKPIQGMVANPLNKLSLSEVLVAAADARRKKVEAESETGTEVGDDEWL